MLISVVPIGNSKGIRIPKNVLEQLNIKDKVELEVNEKEILIRPIDRKPRQGWLEALSSMHENRDDYLIVSDITDDEAFEWEW